METYKYEKEKKAFVLRAELNLPDIQKDEEDFEFFDSLYELWETGNEPQKEFAYNKMLQLMLNFFTKTTNKHLLSCGAMSDIDDFDSVIALTLWRSCQKFDSDFGSFGNYATAAIKRELYKEFRRSLPYHFPANFKLGNDLSKEVVCRTVSLDIEANEKTGVSEAMKNGLDGTLTQACIAQDIFSFSDLDSTFFDTLIMNQDLLKKVSKFENGYVVLYRFGFDCRDGEYYRSPFGKKRTINDTADYFNIKVSDVRKIINKVSQQFRAKYPSYLADYMAA